MCFGVNIFRSTLLKYWTFSYLNLCIKNMYQNNIKQEVKLYFIYYELYIL
jgi:hypothetical protein